MKLEAKTHRRSKRSNNQPAVPFPPAGRAELALRAIAPEQIIDTCSSSSHRSIYQVRFGMSATDGSQADPALCATYLKALGDPIRLNIVRALQAGPMSVSDLALLLEIEMANVSHHLRVLFHADIVTTERSGKYIYYAVNKEFLKNRSVVKSLDFGCCKIDLRD